MVRHRRSAPRRVYAAAVGRLARWIGLKLFLIYLRPLGAGRENPEGLSIEYVFRELDVRDLERLADDPQMQLDPGFLREAAQRGDLCFAILYRDRLVASRWYSFRESAPCEDGLHIHFAAPGRIYGYKMFTHPEHRGKRLHLLTMQLSDAALMRRGHTQVAGYIETHNFSSLRGYSRMQDAACVGFAVSIKLFGWRVAVNSAGARRNGIRILTRA